MLAFSYSIKWLINRFSSNFFPAFATAPIVRALVMNYLTNQSFSSFRNWLSAHRLLSSISVCQHPSIISGEISSFTAPFDPFLFFADRTQLRHCSLETTRVIHALLLARGLLPSNVFLTKSLLRLYSKSASMVNALKLFDTIPQSDVVSCNIMISGYNQNHLFEESWNFFCKMHFLGFEWDEVSYRCVLSACSALQVPLLGKLIFSHTTKNGYFLNESVRSALIDTFSKIHSFEEACRVFRDALCPKVYSWNAIIAGALRNGEYSVVLDIFREMCFGFLRPDSHTYSSVLAACAALEDPRFGKAVQARVIRCAAEDVFVCTTIVDLYAKCGLLAEAMKAFSQIPNPNVVSWTAILSGYIKKNDAVSALEIFKEMRKVGVEINDYTITSVVAACAKPSMIKEAIQIHAWVLKCGFYLESSVAAALISMYSKIGCIEICEIVFEDLENIQSANVVNILVSSFSQNQRPHRAIDLFLGMLCEGLKPDEFCLCSLLSVIDCLNLGKQIHSYTLKTGLLLGLTAASSLFTMYSKCGSLGDSFKVFKEIRIRDNVSWASMISGFREHGYPSEAIRLFGEMLADGRSPDETTLSAVLAVCSSLPSLHRGKEIHGYALRTGFDTQTLVGSALVHMYSKCDSLRLARQVFDGLFEKDPFSCSSLISGYSENGLIEDAFQLFRKMLMSGYAVDSFTVSPILGALAFLGRSSEGAQLHAYVTKMGLYTEPSVGSSLVTMYSKSGRIKDCRKAFRQIDSPDLIAWTAMVASYAQHGRSMEALQVYNLMKENAVKPDKVTFLEVLCACSHGGLVEEGYFHLNSMAKDYGIEPENRHYACMVDAISRSGRLKEAERFIKNMPIKPDASVWGTLLAACKVHGNTELGKLAAQKVIELEPSDAGAYVSLSNILAEVGEWDEVQETRKKMKGISVRKEPGWSFV